MCEHGRFSRSIDNVLTLSRQFAFGWLALQRLPELLVNLLFSIANRLCLYARLFVEWPYHVHRHAPIGSL